LGTSFFEEASPTALSKDVASRNCRIGGQFSGVVHPVVNAHSLRTKPELFLNKLTGKLFGTETHLVSFLCHCGGLIGETNMKKLLISAMATALVMSFAVSAEAATSKQKVSAEVQASCKAQAAKKYSAIHFMKRRNFVDNCIAQHANAKAKAKPTAAREPAKPATTGQAPKPAQ
jgi:hypothetical protein